MNSTPEDQNTKNNDKIDLNSPVWVVSVDEKVAIPSSDGDCMRVFFPRDLAKQLHAQGQEIKELTLRSAFCCGDTLSNDMPYWICTTEAKASALTDLIGKDIVQVQKFSCLFTACCSDNEIYHEFDTYLSKEDREKVEEMLLKATE